MHSRSCRPVLKRDLMNEGISIPAVIEALRRETERLGFTMASEPKTGSLLRTLAGMKPGGAFSNLEQVRALALHGCPYKKAGHGNTQQSSSR